MRSVHVWESGFQSQLHEQLAGWLWGACLLASLELRFLPAVNPGLPSKYTWVYLSYLSMNWQRTNEALGGVVSQASRRRRSVSLGWSRALGLDNWENLGAASPTGQVSWRPGCWGLDVEEAGEGSWEGSKAGLSKGQGLETSQGGKMAPGYRSPGKPERGVVYDGTWKGKREWGVWGRWLWRQDGRAGSPEEAGLGALLGREIWPWGQACFRACEALTWIRGSRNRRREHVNGKSSRTQGLWVALMILYSFLLFAYL